MEIDDPTDCYGGGREVEEKKKVNYIADITDCWHTERGESITKYLDKYEDQRSLLKKVFNDYKQFSQVKSESPDTLRFESLMFKPPIG